MKIKAGPIWSYLYNCLPEVLYKLDEALAFEIKGARFNRRLKTLIDAGLWDGKSHFFNRNTGKFPTGLLDRVKELVGWESSDELIDNRFPADYSWSDAIDRAKTLELRGISLSGHQREAIVNNVKNGRGLDLIATNGAKSEIIIGTTLAIRRKTLWLVMRKDLLYQCSDRWTTRTGLKSGLVGDGHCSIGDLMTVAMSQSINAKEGKWKIFLKNFDILMLDEGSHAQSKSWQTIANNCPASFRFALTGSMPAESILAHKIMAVSSNKVISRISNDTLIKSGWSAKPLIHMRPVLYPPNRLNYADAYAAMVQSHEGYLNIIVNDIVDWYNKGKQILVIVDRIRQGSRISQELGGRDIPTIFLSGKHDGGYRKNIIDKFRSGKLQVLIASSILNEGIDIPSIECLILAGGGLSPGRQLQRIGRALRKKPDGSTTVDIVDYFLIGNDYMEEHSQARLDLYESEKFDIELMNEIKVGHK